MSDRRAKVKEPPREGNPDRARFHLKDSSDGGQTIGWSSALDEAVDWLAGFGEWSTTYVIDRETRTVIRPKESVEDHQSWAVR